MPSNFGGNQRWCPPTHRPEGEEAVLSILRKYRGKRIRAVGAGHSWSAIATDADITLDMSWFDDVWAHKCKAIVEVGAGCVLQRLLDELHASSDQTLPTLGVIKRQTIAGAISTGTHGSGRPGLSQYVVGMRVAAYDHDGEPRAFEYREGQDELKAACCALGCMGVILRVDLATVPKYRVAENAKVETTLERVLDLYRTHPLTQFALAPYSWKYLVFARAVVAGTEAPFAQRCNAFFRRLINTVWVDVLFHLLVKLSVVLGNYAVRILQRFAPVLACTYRRTDDAEHVLTMRHDLWRHEEMELFVPSGDLPDAIELLRYATEVFAGDEVPAPRAATRLDARLSEQLKRSRGLHTHHYPFSIRRLEREDALISMGCPHGADQARYAISVFTYQSPDARQGFYAFCAWLARAMCALYDARLHWGKHFPLAAAEIARLYPRLKEFKDICHRTDPRGVFGNHYTAEVLGLPAGK